VPDETPHADLSPRDAIGAAARRVAGFAEALIEAHNDFAVPHGPFDDLTDPAFHAAARTAMLETMTEAQVHHIGQAFGAVAELMNEQADVQPHISANHRWATLQGFLRQSAASLAPGTTRSLDDLPSLGLVQRPTPRIVRFELLAALASAAGAARLFDAASWVGDIAPTLHGDDARSEAIPDAPGAAAVRAATSNPPSDVTSNP
jgi:hypothetical protein